jgi:hypothetical protein
MIQIVRHWVLILIIRRPYAKRTNNPPRFRAARIKSAAAPRKNSQDPRVLRKDRHRHYQCRIKKAERILANEKLAMSEIRMNSIESECVPLLSARGLLSLVLGACAFAQIARPADTLNPSLFPLQHTSWTEREGAPPQINDIAQAPDGSLWLAPIIE